MPKFVKFAVAETGAPAWVNTKYVVMVGNAIHRNHPRVSQLGNGGASSIMLRPSEDGEPVYMNVEGSPPEVVAKLEGGRDA